MKFIYEGILEDLGILVVETAEMIHNFQNHLLFTGVDEQRFRQITFIDIEQLYLNNATNMF